MNRRLPRPVPPLPKRASAHRVSVSRLILAVGPNRRPALGNENHARCSFSSHACLTLLWSPQIASSGIAEQESPI